LKISCNNKDQIEFQKSSIFNNQYSSNKGGPMSVEAEVYKPANHIRVVTATSLFDGHDAAINIMRRILQDTGVEVIHMGHNRSVREIADAAIEEDVQGIAVSSYQGGHIEFFKYLVDLLRERDATHIKIFGGGGGVIVPEEIKSWRNTVSPKFIHLKTAPNWVFRV